MKILFVYFGKKQVCKSANEAVQFINSICGIEVNVPTEKKIERMFSGEYRHGEEIKTTGCGATSIKTFEALGDTVKEHDAVYAKEMKAHADALKKAKAEAAENHKAEMSVIRKGTYFVNITYSYFDARHNRTTLSEYEDYINAESGKDASQKALYYLESKKGSVYVESDHISFVK